MAQCEQMRPSQGLSIHHDRTLDFTASDALDAAGLDTSHAHAFDDDRWDDVLHAEMRAGLDLTGDDYFHFGPYLDPVGDYVGQAKEGAEVLPHPLPAPSWQHTLADLVQAVVDAGFRLERITEQKSSSESESP